MEKKEIRSWTFTINNWSEIDYFGVALLMKKATYGVVGKEIGENGTPHLQGYIRLRSAVTLSVLKKSLPRAHLEPAIKGDCSNCDYCSKEGDFKEWGVKGEGQGSRTDIKDVSQKIRNLEITIEDVMFDYPELYVRYSRAFEQMFNAVQKPRSSPPEVYWRWGLAGVGKTKWVYDTFEQSEIYPKDNTPWWNGYKQQKVILIDDFDNTIPFRTFLRILDRYEYTGQIKGGYVQINSPIIVITSEFPPTHYWSGNEHRQVFRRLKNVLEIR